MILSIDPDVAAFVGVAIREYRPVARADGWRIPDSVGVLEKALLDRARWVDARPSVDSDGQPCLRLDTPTRPAHDAPVKLVLTYRDVAVLLGVSPKSLQRLVNSGALPTVMIGRTPRVRRADLDAYVDGLAHRSMRDTIETKGVSA